MLQAIVPPVSVPKPFNSLLSQKGVERRVKRTLACAFSSLSISRASFVNLFCTNISLVRSVALSCKGQRRHRAEHGIRSSHAQQAQDAPSWHHHPPSRGTAPRQDAHGCLCRVSCSEPSGSPPLCTMKRASAKNYNYSSGLCSRKARKAVCAQLGAQGGTR